MLPRKRHRPSPAEANSTKPAIGSSSQQSASTTSHVQNGTHGDKGQMPASQPEKEAIPTAAGADIPKELRKAKSWYGPWRKTPNKASASTSVAKENILGGTVRSRKAPDLSRYDPKKADDTISLYSTTEPVSKLSKAPKSMPNTPILDEPSVKATNTASTKTEEVKEVRRVESDMGPSRAHTMPVIPASDATASTGNHPTNATLPPPSTASSGWLGWLSKAPILEPSGTSVQHDIDSSPEVTKPEDETKPSTADAAHPSEPAAEDSAPATAQPPIELPSPQTVQSTTTTSSWFGFWGYPGYSAVYPKKQADDSAKPPPQESNDEDVAMDDAPDPTPVTPKKDEAAPKAGSTWAFWSRDSPKNNDKPPQPESGEIAVIGQGSEAHPEPVVESDVSQPSNKETESTAKTKETSPPARKLTWSKSKRTRPASMDLDSLSRSSSTSSRRRVNTDAVTQDPIKPAATESDQIVPPPVESEALPKQPPNLLLPSFSNTYQLKENPSMVQQVTRLLLRTAQRPTGHVFRVKEPPKIRKAIAIGVHGLFPASYLRPMIGQPTGTSLRFATLCSDAIRRWADAHGCEDCEIERVALEGDGKIKDRVENLWKLMLNWIDHIRSADLIVMACHSQGVPVSIMLLEKLIDLGIITNAKIGVCAMAGVSMGPFPDIKSGLLMGSAAELWDFGNPESENSRRFETALKHVLNHGARITFIGSIDDQLVPMESAIYSPANHPYIYRAVFIDGRVHAPDFLAHLVGFALKLRNLGVPDHGLIRELSVPLAGSLYSGAGHSRLYYDAAIYDLAVEHALETVSATTSNPPCTIGPREPLGPSNPYVLPWIMRGLLEEKFVKTELSKEADELLHQFENWKPTNKALKDVKYRLEAIRSML